MPFFTRLVGVALPYLTLVVFAGGSVYRIVRLARAPQHLHWELFPYPHNIGGQLRELVTEVVSLRSLYLYKRKLWGRSLLMHWGLYLLIVWVLLMLVGLGEVIPLTPVAFLGAAAACLGAVLLLLFRLTDPEMRGITGVADCLNLGLVAVVPLVGVVSGFFARAEEIRTYLAGVFTFHPLPPADLVFSVNLLLIQLFLLHLPAGRMIHFAAKYFTYHEVKWGELGTGQPGGDEAGWGPSGRGEVGTHA